jgi:hypothetical protein
MFIETVLAFMLTVREIRHEQDQEPHTHQTVQGEFLKAYQGGGYTLSALVSSSLVYSGFSYTYRTS